MKFKDDLGNAQHINANIINVAGILFIAMLALAIFASMMQATPYGPDAMANISTTTKSTTSASSRNDSRGTISIMEMNVSQQTSKWKAYVGNISGKVTLDDSSDQTIYDWSLTSFTGEVYATRTSTAITWSGVTCATVSEVETEQTALQHTVTAIDSLNNTFTDIAHPAFWAGPSDFTAGECGKAANLYVDDTANSDTWHEILLHDGTNLVYASIINSSADGYSTSHSFDFQMIVASNGSTADNPPLDTYYFYVEIS